MARVLLLVMRHEEEKIVYYGTAPWHRGLPCFPDLGAGTDGWRVLDLLHVDNIKAGPVDLHQVQNV